MTNITSHAIYLNLIVAISAYLVGSIPFGLLISKSKGVDIREHGSKNIGATNVGRIVGKKAGLLTLACDFLKAFIPVILCRYFLAAYQGLELSGLAAGLFAFLGHCFSLYLGFRGGKGVATGAGVILGLCPLTLAAALPFFLAVVRISGYVSLGSVLTAAFAPVVTYFICRDVLITATIGLIGLIILIRHQDNISRLMKGEEKSWRKKD